jgi:hypothetical protein
MDVHDATGRRVGTVERVYLGGADEETIARGGGPATAADPSGLGPAFMDDRARALAPDRVPETLRARLLRHGVIRIDGAGLLAADRDVAADQVEHVAPDGVHLRVRWGRLPAA